MVHRLFIYGLLILSRISFRPSSDVRKISVWIRGADRRRVRWLTTSQQNTNISFANILLRFDYNRSLVHDKRLGSRISFGVRALRTRREVLQAPRRFGCRRQVSPSAISFGTRTSVRRFPECWTGQFRSDHFICASRVLTGSWMTPSTDACESISFASMELRPYYDRPCPLFTEWISFNVVQLVWNYDLITTRQSSHSWTNFVCDLPKFKYT